ncbi:MAG: hypothetical protein EP315_00665 [Gammaproteobacteria bacterium]|nr:MAG: hypothetical protein EP315_00665 [Gammaproteobacteria bacterium]
MIKKCMLLCLCLIPTLSTAALMMENRDASGEISRIYIEGNKARVEIPREKAYMVMDVQQQSMKMVSHQERTVMDMSDIFKNRQDAKGSSGQRVDSYTDTKGLGPRIAGYETEEYEIRANGNYCGSVFVSVEAMKQADLKRFGTMMQKMSSAAKDNINNMLGGHMNSFLSPCQVAAEKQMDRLMTLGIPMRVVDEKRQLESEIVRIEKNAKLPANAFDIPKDYRQTNPGQMMNDAMQQMKQMQPQMQEMMKNLPPEMQEMMRRQMGQ